MVLTRNDVRVPWWHVLELVLSRKSGPLDSLAPFLRADDFSLL